ncbi:DUF2076 domain-containing protein [Rhizobium sp. XQZ8]|uniref:DUF2076 domain-containing protein n=1 Tax=Rhizobium populisoli TaxID=2859785 RepID=UPI001C6778EA|nr:DUF2076 domain-containing protein [Rhizobium populisoli]MBW6423059.1 DUF2076 domain-containing protein [Rhizobium populisoli]
MSPEERQLLTTLFDRVRTASATPRDRDAEAFIEQGTREQPYATYYLAQAVIVQEKGLEAAANRIRELEERVQQLEANESEHHRGEQSGGFLSSIFGSGQSQQSASANASGPWGSHEPRQSYRTGSDYNDSYRAPPPPAGPWTQQAAPSAGGSFLRGALGTAAGVAGGMLLANSLSSIFSSHTNALGWGSPFAGSNPFGTPEAPAQETVINNNYFGDDAVREAAGDSNDRSGSNDNGGWQQADYDDNGQSDNGDFGGGDDSLNV